MACRFGCETGTGGKLRRRGDGLRAQGERPHRSGDILYLLLAEIVEADRQFVAHLIADRARDANPARLAKALQARGHIDPVAEDVVRLDDDVADIDADAKNEPLVFGYAFITAGRGPLPPKRARHPPPPARGPRQHAPPP